MRRRFHSLVTFLIVSASAPAADLVLLPNQDFEAEPLGWSLWPDASQSRAELDANVACSGQRSLRVTAVRASDRAIVNTSTETFKTGVVYRISVQIRRDPSVDPAAISFFINYRGGDDNAIKQRAFPVKLEEEQEGEWSRRSGLFVVPEGIRQWQFCLGVEYTVGRVWFDAIRIEELGKAGELHTDVWTNLTIGVETGGAPLKRFCAHKEQDDAVYQMAARYNALLVETAVAERELRDLERCYAYAGEPFRLLRAAFEALEQRLNQTYLAYADCFRSGQDEHREAFEGSATHLSRLTEHLRWMLRCEMEDIRPTQQPRLPGRLGRQDRGVPPFTPSGKMNRLLFGAWSPTPFVDFEAPFDLEFHSSAPGQPQVHTETEMDLSNITRACDNIEALGYRGTFSYLMFGIHENMYAPEWLLQQHRDEPDFFKVSWDGLKGRSRGSLHSLNYLHPAVRTFISTYLQAYAGFCRNEPRLLFHETSQEATINFTTEKGRRESGYGPHARTAFHKHLQSRYATIGDLNRAWGSQYASFDAIEPPPDAFVEKRQIGPLVAEFERFREQAYIDYLKLIYDSLKAADPAKPVVARHSSLLSGINAARIFETCDVLCYHNRSPKMQLMNVYLNSLNRYHDRGLGYMEDFWGVQEERTRVADERVQRRGLEKHLTRVCIWGRTLQMKWYAYTTGSYLFNYNGNWFSPRYDMTTMRYCAPALAIAKRKMETLDWVLTHSAIVPSRILVLQPSATMRNELQDQRAFSAITAVHHLLYPNGFIYELVPEEYLENNMCQLVDFDVAILPRATYLSEAIQARLARYVDDGGTLVAIGLPGEYTDIATRSGALTQQLAKAAGADQWAQAEQAWNVLEQADTPALLMATVSCGGGKLVALQHDALGGATDTSDKVLKVISAATQRAAWCKKSRFEVVLRIAEDGGRYLFVLNPDVDNAWQDTVCLTPRVRELTDVSVPAGFPVPIRTEAEITTCEVRLAPGDCAVLYAGGEKP